MFSYASNVQEGVKLHCYEQPVHSNSYTAGLGYVYCHVASRSVSVRNVASGFPWFVSPNHDIQRSNS